MFRLFDEKIFDIFKSSHIEEVRTNDSDNVIFCEPAVSIPKCVPSSANRAENEPEV